MPPAAVIFPADKRRMHMMLKFPLSKTFGFEVKCKNGILRQCSKTWAQERDGRKTGTRERTGYPQTGRTRSHKSTHLDCNRSQPMIATSCRPEVGLSGWYGVAPWLQLILLWPLGRRNRVTSCSSHNRSNQVDKSTYILKCKNAPNDSTILRLSDWVMICLVIIV